MNAQYPAQYAPQPIVINNSAAASATSGGHGHGLPLVSKRQSLTVHFWLFMTTAGIGNYFYARHCRNTLAVRVSH